MGRKTSLSQDGLVGLAKDLLLTRKLLLDGLLLELVPCAQPGQKVEDVPPVFATKTAIGALTRLIALLRDEYGERFNGENPYSVPSPLPEPTKPQGKLPSPSAVGQIVGLLQYLSSSQTLRDALAKTHGRDHPISKALKTVETASRIAAATLETPKLPALADEVTELGAMLDKAARGGLRKMIEINEQPLNMENGSIFSTQQRNAQNSVSAKIRVDIAAMQKRTDREDKLKELIRRLKGEEPRQLVEVSKPAKPEK